MVPSLRRPENTLERLLLLPQLLLAPGLYLHEQVGIIAHGRGCAGHFLFEKLWLLTALGIGPLDLAQRARQIVF